MSLGQSAGLPGRTHDRRHDDTAVGWFTWVGVWPVSQVAVFAGGERKYGALHGRCNATHADGTGKHHSCCAAYPVCCIHCAAKPQTSRNFSLCAWVGMPPTESCRRGVGSSHMEFDT